MTGVRRTGGGALAALLLAVTLASCGGTGLTLGRRSVSVCYRAIPVAVDAVRDPDARLVGVHRLPLPLLRRHDTALLSTWPTGDLPVCAVALEGSFRAGQVAGAPVNRSGRYALVVLDARSGHVLAATVVRDLPRGLLGRTY